MPFPTRNDDSQCPVWTFEQMTLLILGTYLMMDLTDNKKMRAFRYTYRSTYQEIESLR